MWHAHTDNARTSFLNRTGKIAVGSSIGAFFIAIPLFFIFGLVCRYCYRKCKENTVNKSIPIYEDILSQAGLDLETNVAYGPSTLVQMVSSESKHTCI